MQKYNLQKKSSKRNQDPSRYHNSITNLKFQHKPKYRLSKILIVKHPILDQHWLELCVHPSMNNLISFLVVIRLGSSVGYLIVASICCQFHSLHDFGVWVGCWLWHLTFFLWIFPFMSEPWTQLLYFVFCICVVGW